MAKLLIVDDETNVLYSLRAGLEADDLTIATAKTARQGLAAIQKDCPDVVILDVNLPDQSGLDLFERIKDQNPKLPVIIITAFATTETAIEAMKRGAFEYLLKPVDLHNLRDVVGKAIALARIRSSDQPEIAASPIDDQIVGQSGAMQEVYKAIGRFAPQDVTVLILGESGTGKELVARALFQHSKRTDRPFQAINCAAIPESLLESELFGHEKGAFTGADRTRIGKFEQAHGGTLFLDEIGDMSPTTQAKVLRVLQDGQFERVGGRETLHSDVRLIAATNGKLDEMVAAGRFREDLLYRLNGVTITLQPLRNRPEDIPQLANHFLSQIGGKLEKTIRVVTSDAMQALTVYPWPGNVRELQNAIRYAVIRATADVIDLDCLPASVLGPGAAPIAGRGRLAEVRELVRLLLIAGATDIYRQLIHEVDSVVLDETLRHVQGNQVQASELLGISRTTLRSKLSATASEPARTEQ